MHSVVKYIVAGITAYFAWLVLPYILLALMALLCMAIGAGIGHVVAGYLPADLPKIDFAAIKARFTKAA